MDAAKREEIEANIRRLAGTRDFAGATEAALRGYGREVFEFLAALHPGEDEAREAFSLFAEGLWRGLPDFAWRCSFRTWAYAVAGRSSRRVRRDARRRDRRFVALPEGSRLSAIADEVRSATASYLKTERRSRFAALRASLPAEDQALLLLRVGRRLSFVDLAQALQEEGAPPLAGEALTREAARLRKRFQLVKERLHELGRRAGLVGDDEG
jgi:RNA polymerase sigma-70 factor, ECF subfamily